MKIGILHGLERMTNSINGNPRYRAHIDGNYYTTTPDAGWVYVIYSGMIGKQVSYEVAGKALKGMEVVNG